MSANIYWKPSEPMVGHEVDTHTPSRTVEMLERAVGPLPATLNRDDFDVLRGLEIAGVQGVLNLTTAIAEHGSIYVWVES